MNPGEVLDGRYEITGRLGAGGMGEVYKATHAFLGTPRVIKVVHPNIATNTDAQERFLREARIATKVQHQNVATLHDFAALPDGAHYMVWEFIEGENLAQRLRTQRTLAPRQALAIAIQALHGLEAIHRAGIIHRDISPENLMITPRDEVKIIDLGVAKFDDPDAVSSTRTGIFVGKLRYAAPEQLGFLAEGEKIDGRADIYALAMVLFELLTGRPPYEAKSPHEYFIHHAREVTQPDVDLPAGLPGRSALQQALEKALSRDRRNRFESASAFAAALDGIVRALPEAADTPTLAIAMDTEPTQIFDAAQNETIPAPEDYRTTDALTAPALTSSSQPTIRTPLPGAAETIRTPMPAATESPVPNRGARRRIALVIAFVAILVLAGGAFAFWPKLSEVLSIIGSTPAPAVAQYSVPIPARPAETSVDVTESIDAPVIQDTAPPIEAVATPAAVAKPEPAVRDEDNVDRDEPRAPMRRAAVYVDGPGRSSGNDRALELLRQELRGVREIALRAGGMQVDVYRAINRYLPDLEFVGEADVVIQFDATAERLRKDGQHLAARATIEKNGQVIFRYEVPSYVDRNAAAEAFAQTLADAFDH